MLVNTSCVTSVAYFFVGFDDLRWVYVMTAVNALPVGARTVLTTAMIADTIEFMQWKTGERSEGIIFSMQTFIAKITTAVGGFFGGLSLSLIGYVPNAEQTPQTLTAIFVLITLVPGLTSLLSLWPLHHYEITEARHREILADLAQRAEPA